MKRLAILTSAALLAVAAAGCTSTEQRAAGGAAVGAGTGALIAAATGSSGRGIAAGDSRLVDLYCGDGAVYRAVPGCGRPADPPAETRTEPCGMLNAPSDISDDTLDLYSPRMMKRFCSAASWARKSVVW